MSQIAQQVAATERSMSLEAQGTYLDPDVVDEQVQALIDTRKLWKHQQILFATLSAMAGSGMLEKSAQK